MNTDGIAPTLPNSQSRHKGALELGFLKASSLRTDSVLASLGLAAVAGFVYALLVLGPVPLNPRNIHWLTWDPVTSHIGWELFRQDPHFHWPLTYTDRVGYPQGESVALMDVNALLAVLLKLLSPVLPEPFQYMGLEVVLASTLQFFFALRLFRLLIGRGLAIGALCSAFFLLSPPLTFRMVGHYALTNHWLLTAAIFLFFLSWRAEEYSLRRAMIAVFALAGTSVAINPYLAFQVLIILSASLIGLAWQRRINIVRALAAISILGVESLGVAYAFGFFIPGGRGYGSSGYRYYSMNLVGPFDPYKFRSILFHQRGEFTRGQYEGFCYLGAGIICLSVVVLILLLLHRQKWVRVKGEHIGSLLIWCVPLTLMAASTKITLGSHLIIDLDPRQRLTPMFAVLRASGRLFWAPYYLILTAVLAAPFFLLRRTWASVLVACALIVQVIDTHSLRQWVHSEVNQIHPEPLKSPIWSKLGHFHENLVVLPAWQCGDWAAAGGKEGYRYFGLLAAAQKMRINSYYSGRYNAAGREYQCGPAVSDLTKKPLSPADAYVVSPAVAELIAQGPTGPGKCHDVDRMILCSSRTDFGLSSTLMSPAARLQNAIANPGFEDGNVAPWASYLSVSANASTDFAHTGLYSLAENAGKGSFYQDAVGMRPGTTYTAAAWVRGSPGTTATAQIAIYDPGTNLAAFSIPVSVRPGWQLVTQSLTIGRLPRFRVHLFRDEGRGTVYWDDVQIYAAQR
jgi:hypothetical protein